MYLPSRMTRRIIAALVIASFVGCGGGLTQADMKRMGIRRKQDEEARPAVAQRSSVPEKTPTTDKSDPESKIAATQPDGDEGSSDRASRTHALQQSERDAVQVLSDRRDKPAEPLTIQQRGRMSAENMQRIGQALEAYAKEHGKYPPQALYGPAGTPLLSWRVILLPYLGYEKLYAAFERDKPWNSDVNKPLLEQIPAVYQSPERFDTRTNYLVGTGSSTLYPGPRTVGMRRIEDGLEHTVVMVEVNDELAVPWTKPQEYRFLPRETWRGLGELRQEQVFVLWGGGNAAAVPTNVGADKFRAMFTVDGGETFSAYAVSLPFDDQYFDNLAPPASALVDTSSGSSVEPAASLQPDSTRASSSKLASEYQQAAKLSATLNRPADALLWYYATNIVQAANVRWDREYRWVPALKRPCPAIHFCIGVVGTSTTANDFASVRNRSRQGISKRDAIVHGISKVGEELLAVIETHAESLLPPALAGIVNDSGKNSTNRSRRNQSADHVRPVTYLGFGSRAELLQKSTASAGDILVLFEIGNTLAGQVDWLTCDLVDVARGRSILDLSKIRWEHNSRWLELLENDDTFKQSRWQLEDLFEDTLLFGDWPDQLKPRHAATRVTVLSRAKTMNPLAALSEMCVYRNRKLIDSKQLLDGFRELLGDNEGKSLLLGSEKKRRRVLRRWLPFEGLEELEQLTDASRRVSSYDD